MSMSILYVLGIVVGLLLVAIGCIAIAFVSRKKNCPTEYDERQQMARGKAFKLAFISLALYLLVVSILDATGVRFGDMTAISTLGICISVTLYACSCIINDAYLSVREKPKTLILIFSILIVVNGALSVMRILSDEVIVDGRLTLYSCNLICAVMAVIILAALLLKLSSERRAAMEEDQ